MFVKKIFTTLSYISIALAQLPVNQKLSLARADQGLQDIVSLLVFQLHLLARVLAPSYVPGDMGSVLANNQRYSNSDSLWRVSSL